MELELFYKRSELVYKSLPFCSTLTLVSSAFEVSVTILKINPSFRTWQTYLQPKKELFGILTKAHISSALDFVLY